MSAQTQVLTERQLELLRKAAQESDGFIEPHLHLKGGVKVRMIDFFSTRGLIAQVAGQGGGQWCLSSLVWDDDAGGAADADTRLVTTFGVLGCSVRVCRSHWASALIGSMRPSGSGWMRPLAIAFLTASWLTPRCCA